MTDSLIDRIVAHVLDTPFEALSETVVLAAKKRLIDTMGCALSGVAVEGNDAVLELYRSWGGNPEVAIPGRSERMPLAQAAMIASLQVRSFDFEVCGPEPEGVNEGKMVGHVGSTTEPVAVAVGEYTGASGRELLTAVVLGGDVAARVSVSNRFDFDNNFEVCGTSNAFGATAIAGRLLGLNHDQLRNAFGILLNMMAGSFQGIWDGVHAFKLPGALAAYNGIVACQLSRNGFGGVRDALESRQGYFELYTREPAPQNMVADLGEIFYVHGQHKLHPSCYGNHNPIECVLQIRAEHEFDAADVTAVELDVPPNRIDHFLNQVPTAADQQPKALFTIPYGVANAILRGRPELEHYVAPAIHDPAVLDLAARVRLLPNLPLGNNQHSRMRITLADGRVLEAERSAPKGWLRNPVPLEAIEDKFWRNVRFSGAIPEDQASRALDLIKDLENVGDVAELAAALSAAPVGAAV
ncbi:MmgE/PrpD family protein [Nocardia higoensis]|uniref:MmgE/PrpD family protein n=1 Tax=Nocardia higoensis TaxID=228599 RepID=UPI0002F3FF94|nr:MmgE/PrpD family protein [Nocardia higoensis]